MKVRREDLFNASQVLLVAAGESPEGAALVAETFCKADARGITTHGSYLLNPIFNRVKAGQLTLPTKATLAVDNAAVAVVDGGDGLGPVAGKLAADLAVDRARQFGVGLVLIRNTNSVGSLAYYTEMVAREGMIALMSSNAAPSMAPWGGAEAFTGTNPIAIAIYTGQDLLFSADMATSVVARGKVQVAVLEHKDIPLGWAVDRDGNPTTSAVEGAKGYLLPLGTYKGYGLATIVEVFSSVLSGAAIASQIGEMFTNFDTPQRMGHFFGALDVNGFMPLSEFQERVDALITYLKSVPLAEGVEEILVPGEPEARKAAQYRATGIPLAEDVVSATQQLAAELGVEPLTVICEPVPE